MAHGDKSVNTGKPGRKAGAAGKGREQNGAARPGAGPRAWAAADQLRGAGRKIDSRRKVPFGPVGGSGRKTNLARSS